ncbi:type II CAAX endopeptidase family protein [Streptomyces sp. NPDC005423]|uniref:type II CAAX endopeptidase family protein n=1 Tax=Streptomyces sp. NPDC005423 TaxID=3155343 RepID=UPI0033A9631D
MSETQMTQEQGSEPQRLPRWLRPGWARVTLLVVVFFAVMSLGNSATGALAGTVVGALLLGPAVAVFAVWLYRKLIDYTEQRPVVELDRSTARAGLRRGTVVGLGLFTATMLIISMFGGMDSVGWGSFGGLLASLGISVGAAVCEEIFFRGIVFRLVERRWGTTVALIVSALLFGGSHLFNPDATIGGALAIAIEAGLMLGAAYTATRTLWLPIGVHFGWNLAAGGLWGVTVSGSDAYTGVLHTTLSGPSALTGGGFGPEASVVAILVCSVATVYFLRAARRRTPQAVLNDAV